jgi:hypothetical protein
MGSTMRRWFTALVAVLGMAGAGVAAAAPAAAASSACLVQDSGTGLSYTSLQPAVDAAAVGDALVIRGTCTGSTEVGKNLTLSGQGAGATLTNGLGVLTVDAGATVTINQLTITGALGFVGPPGGGIANDGTLTLKDVTVTGNQASAGAGIFNQGTLTLKNTTVTNNSAAHSGGGIENLAGTLTVNGGRISGNIAGVTGGGIANGGTVILNSTKITGNSAVRGGGGIANSGTVTLTGGTKITGNLVTGFFLAGGGVYNQGGTVTLTGGSSITGNDPDNCDPRGSVSGCTG